jgi:2-methylcitrate dehydratase PrpD
VHVEAYADAVTFCDKPSPRSVIEAKFSFQHAVAVALLRGRPGLADFDPPSIADPALTALRARVTLAEDGALTRAYPLHFGAAVTVTLADGTTLREAVPDALGDPENPLDEAAILGKATTLMQSAGVGRPEAVIAAVLALAEGAPAADLNAALP